jgi:hypothetical protein
MGKKSPERSSFRHLMLFGALCGVADELVIKR